MLKCVIFSTCLEQVCVLVPRLFIKGKPRIIDVPLTSSKVSRELKKVCQKHTDIYDWSGIICTIKLKQCLAASKIKHRTRWKIVLNIQW